VTGDGAVSTITVVIVNRPGGAPSCHADAGAVTQTGLA
jgi:hypothetical protein